MSLVVDGAEWDFNGWSLADVIEAIDRLVGRVSTARDRNEIVWIGDDFQTRLMFGDCDLWSLFSPEAELQLPPELGHELAAWLGRARCYLDEEPWPDWIVETRVQVDELPVQENCDQAWAHHNVRTGTPVACLSLKRAGAHKTMSNLGSVSVHWIVDETTNRAFWRSAIDVHRGTADALERYAPHAFPSLFFHPDVWQGLSTFAGGYLAVRTEVQRYLAVLDDYGNWAFTAPPPALSPSEPAGPEVDLLPTDQIVERRFRGLNLDMAPENPNIRAHTSCRQAREVIVGNRTLYCEWHGKLQPHRNRIHIHAPVSESDGKVVIAKFHEHLQLP